MRVRKKHIVVALVFLGFFAFSNYFMGFFSFDSPTKDTAIATSPEQKGKREDFSKVSDKELSSVEMEMDKQYNQLQNWKEEIDRQRMENNKILEEMKLPAPATQPPPQRNEKPRSKVTKPLPTKALPPKPTKVVIDSKSKDDSKCHYKRDRDYEQDPIIVAGKFDGVRTHPTRKHPLTAYRGLKLVTYPA